MAERQIDPVPVALVKRVVSTVPSGLVTAATLLVVPKSRPRARKGRDWSIGIQPSERETGMLRGAEGRHAARAEGTEI